MGKQEEHANSQKKKKEGKRKGGKKNRKRKDESGRGEERGTKKVVEMKQMGWGRAGRGVCGE